MITQQAKPSPLQLVRSRAKRVDVRPAIAWGLAIALFIIYVSLQPDILSRTQLTGLCADTVTLAAISFGQGLVILTKGIDLSVGGVLSVSSAIAATHFVSPGSELTWSIVIILVAAATGAINGVLVGTLRLQPFIVTLATWSILSGVALLVLPVQGGSVPAFFANWINLSWAEIPNAAWAMIAMIVIWLWFKNTRLCRRIYALGSDQEAAIIAGVRIRSTLISVYAMSGVCAGVAAIFYTMLTASGDPTVGNGFILPSVTAVVIGGTSLFGGSGGFVGTVGGAFALGLIADVVFALNMTSYWTALVDGLLLIGAVLLGGALRSLRSRRLALRV
jgi:ribose transport system permease protein